jgi:hypothetical protein
LSIKGGAGVFGNIYRIEREEFQLLKVDTFVSKSEAELIYIVLQLITF